MRILRFSDRDFETAIARVTRRGAFAADVDVAVADILAQVRRDGDAAVSRFAARFDGADLAPAEFVVSADALAAADAAVEPRFADAIRAAHANLVAFACRGCPKTWRFSPRPGVTVGEKYVPFDRVAAYIPGGEAPLVSTVLHTVTMAAVAGVPEIVVTTPPEPDGTVNPAILYAARIAGATEVYRLGGVYAIGAFAYGTETLRPVQKIVGPGNAYVTAAKRQVYGQVALDLVAGPSEILVIADETAAPVCVAADMLSQAEHGTGREGAALVTTSEAVLGGVATELRRQAAAWPDNAGLRQVLETGVVLILARDLQQAAAIANAYAPEHLEVQTADPEGVAANLTTAGALFLGACTPEPVGDFVAGPSHVLPTGGAARTFSGLTVDHFFRRMSVVRYEREALAAERDVIAAFAEMERLPAHGRSAASRFDG